MSDDGGERCWAATTQGSESVGSIVIRNNEQHSIGTRHAERIPFKKMTFGIDGRIDRDYCPVDCRRSQIGQLSVGILKSIFSEIEIVDPLHAIYQIAD